jgi:2-oxoisovalerate dehydrogenase E2 component (dihydrolipoyl transacylase)
LASVQAFDPPSWCEVQSDKASVETTSPLDDGIVKEFLVQEGEIAKVGPGL